ncbi:MAG: DUF559 domain-containing protein [Armatimonadetes bacterium]|nr:DUF559 domain-containing protein [Armatimonadota bacterium]
MPKPRVRSAKTVGKGRRLRADMSLPEVLLWQELQKKQWGRKFRRQHRHDPYVLDFFCAEVGLDVEIDSAWHDGRAAQDEARDEHLLSLGLCVLRIPAEDVLDSPEACASWIADACDEVSTWRALGRPAGFRSEQRVRRPSR